MQCIVGLASARTETSVRLSRLNGVSLCWIMDRRVIERFTLRSKVQPLTAAEDESIFWSRPQPTRVDSYPTFWIVHIKRG